MMATVTHVTSGLGLRKFKADEFLLTGVYFLFSHSVYFSKVLYHIKNSSILRRVALYFISLTVTVSVLVMAGNWKVSSWLVFNVTLFRTHENLSLVSEL